jgi:hypothetical protein
MGVLTDLFQATDTEIATVCRGWGAEAPLLDEPVLRRMVNPFTKKEVEFMSRLAPEHSEAASDAIESPDFRHLPRIDMKGLSPIHLENLGQVLLQWSPDYARGEVSGRSLAGPPETEISIMLVPDPLVAATARIGEGSMMSVAEEWFEIEQIDSDGAFETAKDCVFVLRALVPFMGDAVRVGRHVFMWMCP